MSDKWQTATLGEIACNISRPFNFKNMESVVFVNTGDVLSGEFLHENKTIAKGLPGQAKKAIEKGDILYSEIRPGNKRYVLVSKDDVENFVVSTKFMVIKATGPVSPEYLYLVLTSRECEEEFKVIADSRSGTFPQITFDSVSYYPVRFPSAKLQKKVVAIDGSITKKIQLNHQINQTLESISQALFKSWFVDFDPVKAKIAALEAGGSEEEALLAAMQVISSRNAEELAAFEVERPEEYAELRATAELFPAAMAESELGEVPEGWNALPILDMVNLIGGGTPKRSEPDYWGGDIFWFSIKDLPIASNVFIVDTEEKITEAGLEGSSTKLLPLGTTIITARGTVGKLALTGVVTAMNQSCYGVVGKKGTGPYLNYLGLHNALETLKRNTHGAVFDTITRSTFESVIQPQACIEVRQSFERLVTPLFEKIKNNLLESKALSEIRDTLLPKLLSGELDVSELTESLEAEA